MLVAGGDPARLLRAERSVSGHEAHAEALARPRDSGPAKLLTTTAVRYRDHLIVIAATSTATGRWGAVVWPPSKAPPTIMPVSATAERAAQDARRVVDRQLSDMDG